MPTFPRKRVAPSGRAETGACCPLLPSRRRGANRLEARQGVAEAVVSEVRLPTPANAKMSMPRCPLNLPMDLKRDAERCASEQGVSLEPVRPVGRGGACGRAHATARRPDLPARHVPAGRWLAARRMAGKSTTRSPWRARWSRRMPEAPLYLGADASMKAPHRALVERGHDRLPTSWTSSRNDCSLQRRAGCTPSCTHPTATPP